MAKVTTFLTFESKGKEAIDFYVSIFKNSKINSTFIMPGSDQLLHASFSLDGQEFMAMDGGAYFKFEHSISLFVSCADQAEVDYFWERLGADGQYLQCGWLNDKYGVSWQIIPTALGELMSNPDRAKAEKVRQAMLAMTKIDIEKLKQAAEAA
jgi:predicted 3-demethylubiquinone-9 3-methyltransferase (glyoxalase superfamily)